MELDSRIKEGKKPLTCFDTEQAKEFLGKECYFSNCKVNYKNLSAFEKFESLTDYCIGTLTAIMDLGDRVFDVDQQCKEFSYCLPCEWVKPEEPEKKYRPYSLNEFLVQHKVGDLITYRLKLDNQPEDFIRNTVMVCGYQLVTGNANTPGEGFINLGGSLISLQTLFNTYETPNNYLYPEVWKPFGVKE